MKEFKFTDHQCCGMYADVQVYTAYLKSRHGVYMTPGTLDDLAQWCKEAATEIRDAGEVRFADMKLGTRFRLREYTYQKGEPSSWATNNIGNAWCETRYRLIEFGPGAMVEVVK